MRVDSRVTETQQALSRLLNGKAGISPAMAIALERIGWSNASFWMRLQAAYELAQERCRQGGMSARIGPRRSSSIRASSPCRRYHP